MIQVDNLSISYHGISLFEKVSFSLQEGERCGLVGRNGSGKTTFFRLLTGEEVPDTGKVTIRKNLRVGSLSQHLDFTRSTLIEEAALGLCEADREQLYKVEKILFGLGFKEEDMQRSPSEFSGGYQLRLHLAKLLIAEPDVLLLDEPTNYLDIVSIRWFTLFLRRWRGGFILVSHDRAFIDSVTTTTIGIHRQKVYKIKGNTEAFFQQVLQEEEVYERSRLKLEKKRSHAQSFIDRFGAKATKAAQASSRKKALERLPSLEALMNIHQLKFHFDEASFPGKRMLEVKDLSFSYENNSLLIKELSFAIEKGERVAIVGKNGYGKSTILRLLARELTPKKGEVICSNHLQVGYFGQTNIDRLNPDHTIEEEVATANRSLTQADIRSICGVMMFGGDQASKPISVLSGGEKSRVLLAKILATPCNLLLLDEPTHHLDIESVEALIDALEEFSGAVVLVTHSELILKRMSLDKIVICHQNTHDIFYGDYEYFLSKDGWHDENETLRSKKRIGLQRKCKKERAELVMQRSKILKPLDREIEKKEKLITELESAYHNTQEELTKQLQSGNGKAIQNLSITLAKQKNTIEKLYDELDTLTNKRDACHSEFETLLKDI